MYTHLEPTLFKPALCLYQVVTTDLLRRLMERLLLVGTKKPSSLSSWQSHDMKGLLQAGIRLQCRTATAAGGSTARRIRA